MPIVKTIIFPTKLNIEMLSKSDSVDNAIEMAKERIIVPVLPMKEKRQDGMYLCIPEEAGYSISEIRLGEGP